MSNAGKGDKWRKTNFKKYYDNWELIEPTQTPNETEQPKQTNLKQVKKLSTGKTRFIYK